MVVFWVCNPREAKITNSEVTIGVDQDVGGLEVAMQNVSRVNVFEASQDLVGEIASVIVTQLL